MEAYGHVEGDVHHKKKKIAVLAVSSVMLVAMIAAVAVGISTGMRNNAGAGSKGDGHDNKGGGEVTASMKAIETICQSAEFKKICVDTLSSGGGNTTDPKELIKVSFNITINHITDAIKQSHAIQELAKHKSGREALRVCREQLDFAIEDLNRAFEESNTFDLSKMDKLVEEVKVWLGGALAYQGTCLDGFEDTKGKTGEAMRKALQSSEELTRNALAIVTEIISVISSFNVPINPSRRLLQHPEVPEDGYPTWVTTVKRRLFEAAPADIKPNIVVAKDGTGKYTTINDALKDVPQKNDQPFVIYVKEGIYDEIVRVTSTNVVMIGDGPLKTKVTGRRNVGEGLKTIDTATFAAVGHGFVAKDMGFENTAGPDKHQAVALRVNSDSSVFYNCQIDGYQDTLYVHSHRQFFRDCTISGTIDFIFGDAKVIFQNCKMVVRKPLDNQQNAVTAQGRRDVYEISAIVFQGCTITADPEYFPVRHQIKTYLGRPWRSFSRTIIMHTHMDDFIDPEGWQKWDGTTNHETCYYAEYQNTGPGADLSKRAKWPGIKSITNEEAISYNPDLYYRGDEWIRRAGVPYEPGMMPQPILAETKTVS